MQEINSSEIKSSQTDLKKNVYISTYGCQMNVNDTERMYSLLEMSNYTPVSSPDQASLILINSCSVREKPVHKVYSEVGKYRKLKAKNPNLKIGVGGCVGQQEKGNLLKNSRMIDFVFGTDSIDQLPILVGKAENTKERFVSAQFAHRDPYQIDTLVRNPGVSTFVNITKGCDNFCTFCVVPFTRGREKSRKLAEVIEDINRLTQRGVKEVTLLGQNVNSYESDCGADFSDLLSELAKSTDVQRIRYTTSHPKDFDEKLVSVMSKYKQKICEYIHLPFQSGNSRILEMMNRGYTREQYLDKIKMIRDILPEAVFSTDIIVGFPSETEEEFQDTLSLIDAVGYETLFAFKYSPRPMTKAARFENQIAEDVKSERLNRLFDFHDPFAMNIVKRYQDQVLDILVEQVNVEKKMATGRSRQNKLTHFTSEDTSLVGKTVPVKILQAFPAVLRGEVV
jgi:tRNA-2-methylthio-N6-dimethylallyladenosine synthase